MPAKIKAGFTLVDVVLAVVIFGVVSLGAMYALMSHKNYRQQSAAALRQNTYTTYQASIALEGLDPSKIISPLQPAVGGSPSRYGSYLAGFETNAVSLPAGAQTNLAGVSPRLAIAYNSGGGNARGVGFGYAVQAGGATVSNSATALAPPSFRIYGDLSNTPFPLTEVANLPPTNPPGTFYRYTVDGSTPTVNSAPWNNDPNWTISTFPAEVTLRAFNSDAQYSPSAAVTAFYTYGLTVVYARADGRTANLYAFTLPELSAPNSSGVVLSSPIPGASIRYSLDGSDPSSNGLIYNGPFTPVAGQFAPTVTLRVAAASSDARYSTPSITNYNLTPLALPLPTPVIATDNSAPLAPGTPVFIDYAFPSGSTRTELNAMPTAASSPARSFPLD